MEVALEQTGLPILEYDSAPTAILEPSHVIDAIDIPEDCVLCFFQDVISDLLAGDQLTEVVRLRSEIGPNPVYAMTINGRSLAVVHPGVGAPLAAAFLDELIALGCRRFVACGGCGVLNEGLTLGHVVVPYSAVRDEGTSYHYLPPSREVAASQAAVVAIEATLQHHDIDYVAGKTWTTDAIYRETAARAARRRKEGCIVVEMEAAAFFAVAQFRGVAFGQLLYSGDDLSGDNWDSRGWQHHTSAREKLFRLAAEACLAIS